MTAYLLTAQEGDVEKHVDVPEGPLVPDLTVVGLAYAWMAKEGLKVAHVFEADSERWFVRLELP